jgi:pyruvate, water dikinase
MSPKSKDNRLEKNILWFKNISLVDIPLVGGKNASLGEMYGSLTKQGVSVPNGFAVTSHAYWNFLRSNNLDKTIKELVKQLDVHDITNLKKTGKKIRALILASSLPKALEKDIIAAYKKLAKKKRRFAVAVRSSATAEDLPDASFAGQQETFLNIRGEKDLLVAVKKCIASLFTDRALSYREGLGFDHMSVALSVAVQEMVDGSNGASGVMFTLDTESGFTGVSLITSSYGLGEYVVKGRVIPDQFYIFKAGVKKNKNAIISRTLGSKEVKLVYGKTKGTAQAKVSQANKNKFSIEDKDIIQLSKWGSIIEEHYKTPQDIEWVKDGKTGKLYIVQARPETVKARRNHAVIEHYSLNKKGKEILRGIAVGQKIGAGKVRVIDSPKKMKDFKEGEVLVTRITDPDWEPLMRKAAAIITEQGGKTSHAAIVSRELGVPCIVGAKGARKTLKQGKKVTVSCANGDEGVVYQGILPFEVKRTELKKIPKTKTKIMMNMGDPDNAFGMSFLPNEGVGLARLEFIFTNFIRIHPLALVNYHKLKDKKAKKQITAITKGYKNKTEYCVEKLAEGIARIAAASYDNEVIVRLSDFKTNEYATMIGGKQFEPKEENPMLGWRGASRYYSKEYKPAFRLECEAIKRVRDEWGLTNVIVMVPFCRTPEEGKKVLETMKEFGLTQGENGLKVYVMCEIPSNVVLAEEFAKIFDGFSIGSNDLTQLTLGLDRDTGSLMHIGDATDDAVKKLIKDVIHVAHKHKKKIGICGQAPSDSPEFAEFLVREGIDSISLNPDTLIETRQHIAAIEKTLGKKGKKTHRGYLGLVAAVGLVAAGLIGLGTGCSDMHSLSQNNTGETAYVAPAVIREKATEKAMQEKNEERAAEMSILKESIFAEFTLKYPAGWEVSHWNGGVTLRDASTDNSLGYVSIYKQLVALPLSEDAFTSMTVDGYAAQTVTLPAQTDEDVGLTYIQLEQNGNTIVIEGTNIAVENILTSINFTEEGEAITDRPLTHWDQREGRICVQVITYAKEREEAVCKAFSTPCEVPDGWKVCDGGR